MRKFVITVTTHHSVHNFENMSYPLAVAMGQVDRGRYNGDASGSSDPDDTDESVGSTISTETEELLRENQENYQAAEPRQQRRVMDESSEEESDDMSISSIDSNTTISYARAPLIVNNVNYDSDPSVVVVTQLPGQKTKES